MPYLTRKGLKSGKNENLEPAILFRGKLACVINRPATEVLMKDGSRYVMLMESGGKMILRPFDAKGLVCISALNPLEGGRATANFNLDLKQNYRVELQWNVRDMAFECGRVLQKFQQQLKASNGKPA